MWSTLCPGKNVIDWIVSGLESNGKLGGFQIVEGYVCGLIGIFSSGIVIGWQWMYLWVVKLVKRGCLGSHPTQLQNQMDA